VTILSELGMPVFAAGGHQSIDPADYRLEVTGLVAEGRVFTLEEIRALPQTTVDARLTSVSGFSLRADWQGVLWRDFLTRLEPLAGATHATFVSYGGGYSTTVALADLDHPRTMLCLGVNGEPLEEAYGAPVRMLIPQLWGYKSAKWLRTVELTDHMRGGYWEDRGYPADGRIQPGRTLDLNTRQRRPISGGEVTEF
jgi:DMSO/TMAO reductase YedYZ molybdopterin-dependent catalytic subunit